MTTPLLRLENISAHYGPIQVLHGITLSVFPEEIVTIIGANGAGKTTILKCISGIHPISDGTITFADISLTNSPAHQVVRKGLAHIPEGRRIFPRLSVLENLELGAYTRRDNEGIREGLEKVFDLFPILGERRQQLGGTLSGGEQQMLAIARALMSDPSTLLMDEPSMGIAPLIVEKIFDTILRLNSHGITVLLVEQNAHLALSIAQRAYVLEIGKVVIEDTCRNLLADERIQAAYLGE